MTVEETEKIDAIDIHKPSGELVFTIFDHLDWNDERHLLFLQSKINSYVAYICDGQFEDDFPEHRGRVLRIHLASKYEPSVLGKSFIEEAQQILESESISLTQSTTRDH